MIKMKSNKKKIAMATGMIIGVTVLAGAAFASYSTSNGYNVAKTAIKGLMKNDNYTANMSMKMTVDDEEVANNTMTELYDRNGDVKLNKEEVSSSYNYNADYKEWIQDDAIIALSDYDGNATTLVEENASDFLDVLGGFDKFYTEDENEDKRNHKMVNFIELIGDTMVGDLKNNVIYVSGDDNSSTYEMNLDAIQIPEFANAGLSAMFSQMNSNSYNESYSSTSDPFLVLGTDPIVKNAFLTFTVDNEGRFTKMNGSVSMVGNSSDGENHEAVIEVSLDIYDYGVTKPERVDISELPNVHYENMEDIYVQTNEAGENESEIRIEAK